MKKLTITNSDNTKMKVDLVRYFKFKNDCFLVYSIGEVDEKNYMKLYLVRIMEELGFPVVQTIKNESDWNNMQGIVKKVLKELKRNKKKLTEDLDYKEIDGIKVVDPRFFKLDAKLVDILASNYMEGEDNMNNEQILNETNKNEPLESIDETIMKEGIYQPNSIDSSLNENIVVPDIQPVQPIEIEPQSEVQESVIPEVQPILVEQPVEIEPQPEVPENVVPEVQTVPVEQPVEIEPQSEVPENVVPEVQPISIEQPVEIEPQPEVPENVVPEVQPISIEQPIEIEPQPEVPESVIPEVQPIPIEINSDVNTLNVEVAQEQNDSIDYKQLYESLKADNDATNELLDSLVIELGKYKDKYGELEG